MKGDSAQNGFLRRGMCVARQASTLGSESI